MSYNFDDQDAPPWVIRSRMRMFGTCCDLGRRVECVCVASVVCPKHGSLCEGTHD